MAAHNKRLPRTAFEAVCEALANAIRQRREASGRRPLANTRGAYQPRLRHFLELIGCGGGKEIMTMKICSPILR
jgi:hypothetical protein